MLLDEARNNLKVINERLTDVRPSQYEKERRVPSQIEQEKNGLKARNEVVEMELAKARAQQHSVSFSLSFHILISWRDQAWLERSTSIVLLLET